jgi:hypothetical protein
MDIFGYSQDIIVGTGYTRENFADMNMDILYEYIQGYKWI